MDEKEKEELLKTLKDLESKVSALAAPYEDALANRVYQKSQEQFKRWIGLWVAVVTIGIGFIGYKGYSDIIDAGSKKTSEFVSQRAQPLLEEKINAEVSRVVNERVEGLRNQVDRDLASSLSSIKPSEQAATNIRGFVVAAYFDREDPNGQSQPSSGNILVATTPVNLRESPSNSAPIIRIIDKGERVKLLKVSDGNTAWHEVEVLK